MAAWTSGDMAGALDRAFAIAASPVASVKEELLSPQVRDTYTGGHLREIVHGVYEREAEEAQLRGEIARPTLG